MKTTFGSGNLMMLGLEALVSAPALLKDSGLLPNINFPTLGGAFFWNDIVECEGWRIQQNTITQHMRILDPEDVRRAWAYDEEALLNFFVKIVATDIEE